MLLEKPLYSFENIVIIISIFFWDNFSQAETIFNLQDTILTRDKNDVSYLVQELDEVLVSPSKFLESSREISKRLFQLIEILLN